MLDWVYKSILGLQKRSPFTVFSLGQICDLVDFNQPLPVFTRWPIEDSFPDSRALGGKCGRLSRFCFMSRLQGVRICGVFVRGDSNYRLI